MKLFPKKNYKAIFVISIILVFTILYFQAINPSLKGYLAADASVWYQRVQYFKNNNNSFAGLKNSEFLPATLLFLFVPTIFSSLSKITYDFYLNIFLIINIFIIFLHILLCRKQTGFLQTILFLLIILFVGPIMFFRFDGFITLLILLSIWLFKQKKYTSSGFALGWATAMKVFPIFFLPYFLLILWYNRKKKDKLIHFLSFFSIAVIVPILIFLLLGGSFEQISEALNFHALKYVSIESIPGSLLTGISLFNSKKPLPLIGGYGIWGIKSNFIDTIGLSFFNYLWIIPVGVFYLILVFKKKFLKKMRPGVLFCLMILFLVFSKNLHPQYIFWFIALFPFLKIKRNGWTDYLTMFFLLSVIALANQNIYPRLYDKFLNNFYRQGRNFEIFYLQALRNLSIILLLLYSCKVVFIKKSLE